MVVSSTRPVTVSRTSSSSSIDFTANAFNATELRRTRKRISSTQLTQLEQLYSQSSHPTRDERDALAKRIQMETKSVTIWFQNKRQTDRKVALHNATNSHNINLPKSASILMPNIILTAPTSPAYPLEALVPDGVGRRSFSDGMLRKQPPMRPTTLKRTSSLACSVTSISTIPSKTHPSLDHVASRSEIRLTERPSVTHPSSETFSTSTNTMTPAGGSDSSPFAHNATSNSPTSPPPSTSAPLWATMLSSPPAPSSPPTAEYVAYTSTRKSRTLDWACAAARFVGEDGSMFRSSGDEFRKLGNFTHSSRSSSHATLGPACAAAREREYEEATAMTEDEAELVTPHGSQDARMPWVDDRKAVSAHFPQATEASSIMPATYVTNQMDKMGIIFVAANGWEEDEMHAALALCGLRG